MSGRSGDAFDPVTGSVDWRRRIQDLVDSLARGAVSGANEPTQPGVSDHGDLTGLDDPADHPWAVTNAELLSGIASAQNYTDGQTAAALAQANDYADQQIAEALASIQGSQNRLYEGMRITGFGHSYGYSLYLPEIGQTGGSSYASQPVNRLANRLGGASPDVRNRAGANLQYCLALMIGGAKERSPWVPSRDYGIIVWQCLRNDVSWWAATGMDPHATAQASYQNCLRTAFRYPRASAVTQFTAGANWSTVLNGMASNGTEITTTTAGAFVDITFSGPELLFHMKRLNYDTPAGSIEVLYDTENPSNPAAGGVIATIDGGHGFETTPTFPYQGLGYYWHSVRLLAADFGDVVGSRTVRLRKAAGNANPVTLDCWYTGQLAIPRIFFVLDGDEFPYWGTGVDGTTWNTWRGLITAVCNDAEFSPYVFDVPLPDWDPNGMTDSHGIRVHPNDVGNAYIVDELETAVRANITTFVPGVHVI